MAGVEPGRDIVSEPRDDERVERAARPTRPRASRPKHRPGLLASAGVLLAVAGLVVATTLPAAVVADRQSAAVAAEQPQSQETVEVQAVAASTAESEAPASVAERDGFGAQSYASVQRELYQAAGIGYAPGFVPTAGSVRWPFQTSVEISSGYGPRDGSFHKGIDFVPGEGTPIGAIASGVVTEVSYGTGYGHYVVIQHNIDGQRVDSLYAHMIDGSSPLYPGQQIDVGTIVGLTGNTGYSTGAHLHFEILIGGSENVDPYEWLVVNATNG